jgi:hypothetical protein
MTETGDLGLGRDGSGEELGPGGEWRLARFVMVARMPGGPAGATGEQGEQGQGSASAEPGALARRR